MEHRHTCRQNIHIPKKKKKNLEFSKKENSKSGQNDDGVSVLGTDAYLLKKNLPIFEPLTVSFAQVSIPVLGIWFGES